MVETGESVDRMLAMAWRIRSGHEGAVKLNVVNFLDEVIAWVNAARKELQSPPVVEAVPVVLTNATAGPQDAATVSVKTDRKAYLKEYMAKRRAAERAAKESAKNDMVPQAEGEDER